MMAQCTFTVCVCVCARRPTCLIGSGTRYRQHACVRRTAVSRLILWPTDTYTGFELLSELRSAWFQRQKSAVTFQHSSRSPVVIIIKNLLRLTFGNEGFLWSQQQQDNAFVRGICFYFLCICPLPHLSEHFAWGAYEWEAVSSSLQSSYLWRQRNKNQSQNRCTACQNK